MPEYLGWDGKHYRPCLILSAFGSEEDFRLHLDDCDPETCALPRSCQCADVSEASYWAAVNQRIDQARGK